MPIPNVRSQQILEGSVLLCRTDAVFDPALNGAREGVLAMLLLGEPSPNEDGSKAEFRLNSAFLEEAYTIRVHENGVFVESGGIAGAVYAASTLVQLVAEHEGHLPHCVVDDAPEHPWRGLLID
ncbi:MAG: glycoside hydrolase family 20 zincin-like fold domain-containing protein, partial [Eubacteriales bacterium]